MATLTECPDCEKFFAGTRCECGYTLPKGNVIEGPWQKPAWMLEAHPCTAEENYRAAENVRAVLDHDITVHQAQLVLHAIFQGREQEF